MEIKEYNDFPCDRYEEEDEIISSDIREHYDFIIGLDKDEQIKEIKKLLEKMIMKYPLVEEDTIKFLIQEVFGEDIYGN